MKGFKKFGNTPTVVDGRKFASKAEAKRYGELKLLERAGQIKHLQCALPGREVRGDRRLTKEV